MTKDYAILPCNGLDKTAGSLAREIALRMTEQTKSEMICPVLYGVSEARYQKLAAAKPLLVIDGCATRCASKLATTRGLKITEKLNISDASKEHNIDLGSSLRLGENELALGELIMKSLLQEEQAKPAPQVQTENLDFPEHLEYETYKKDKFIFRLPKEGFMFNENDCWAYIIGNKARIGVTDYVQQSLSDIMFFSPPVVGNEIEQFGELGSIESGKAVFEVICPLSGVVTAVNDKLIDFPEYINENPYEKGWIAELELSDLENDQDLLLAFEAYLEIMKRKVDDFHV